MAEVTKRVAQIFIEDGQADVTLKGLTAKARQLRNELGRMTIGSPEWNAQVAKLKAVNGDLARMQAEVRGTNGVWGQMQKTLGPIGPMLIATFGGAAIARTVRKGIEDFHEHEQAVARVGTALENMGEKGGVSLQQLTAEADRLQNSSLFSDEDILDKATAQLVSFGNIAGDNLLRAQQAAVDLSTTMGKDLSGAALAVGKALSSPVDGMTALQRIGVRFSDDQKAVIKEMVETGRTAEAQGIIIAELEKRYKGQAAAQAEALGGARRLQVATDELSEAIGARFAGSMGVAKGVLADLVNGIADFIAPAQTAVEAWEEQSSAVLGLTQNVEPLLGRYDELAGKTDRSVDEQAEMEDIISKVATAIPLAATGFDEYGKAIGLSTDKARNFIQGQKDLLQYMNKEAIAEETEKLADLTAQHAKLGEFMNASNGTFINAGRVYRNTAEKMVELVTVGGKAGGQIVENTVRMEDQNAVLAAASLAYGQLQRDVNGSDQQLKILNGTLAETTQEAAQTAAAMAEATKRMEQVAEFIKGARADIELDRMKGMEREIEAERQKYAKQMELAGDNAEQQAELAELFGQAVDAIRQKYADKETERLLKLDADIKGIREQHEAWKLGKDEAELEQVRDQYEKLFEAAKGNAKRTAEIQVLLDEDLDRKRAEQAVKRQEEAAKDLEAQDAAASATRDLRTQHAQAELELLDAKHAQERTKVEEQGGNLQELYIRQNEERVALVAELNEAARADIDEQFEELYATYDQQGLDTTELQRMHGDALNLLRRQQGQAAVDTTNAQNADILASDKKRMQAQMLVAQSTFDIFRDLWSIAGADAGEMQDFQKLSTLFQLTVDTASAISSLTAASEANPLNAITAGGAGIAQFAVGLARITANIARAAALLSKEKPKAPAFAVGGPTYNSEQSFTTTNQTTTSAEKDGTWWDKVLGRRMNTTQPLPSVSKGGAVNTPTLGYFGEEGREYVVPNWMYVHPDLQPVYHFLETIRNDGSVPAFAGGGGTAGQGTLTFAKGGGGEADPGDGNDTLEGLRMELSRLSAILDGGIGVNFDQMTRAQERIAQIQNDSQIRT